MESAVPVNKPCLMPTWETGGWAIIPKLKSSIWLTRVVQQWCDFSVISSSPKPPFSENGCGVGSPTRRRANSRPMADSEHLNFRSVSREAWTSPEPEEMHRNGSKNGTVSREGKIQLGAGRLWLTNHSRKTGAGHCAFSQLVYTYLSDNFLQPPPQQLGFTLICNPPKHRQAIVALH